MQMQKVKSSNVAQVGYDGDNKKLRVLFKSGGLYEYDDVSLKVFEGLQKAKSKGQFVIHKIVRAKYKYRKVENDKDTKSRRVRKRAARDK